MIRKTLTLIFLAMNIFSVVEVTLGLENDRDLILTKWIKSGDLGRARQEAEDRMIKGESWGFLDKPIKSYSGYLTINETHNSNLFFWFFPVQNPEIPAESAPVILWVNEDPGVSLLRSVFLENGPFFLDKENKLKEREFSWTKTHSMLYIDAPVGSGFSFAENERGFANTAEDIAQELWSGLDQFFQVFPEFQSPAFYIAGESYAGTVISHLALMIDRENTKGQRSTKVNLQGLIMGSPWLDPVAQSHVADYYFAFGLLDEAQRDEMILEENQLIEFVKNGKHAEAFAVAEKILLNPESLYNRMTGNSDLTNILRTNTAQEIERFSKFLNEQKVHQYLHVGLHKFLFVGDQAFSHLASEYMKRDTELLEQILDKGYKVLIYAPQLDPFMVFPGVQKMVDNLKWRGAAEFLKSKRRIWRVEEEVAGYVKTALNLNFVFVRDAGKYAVMDQPEWMFNLVNNFTLKGGLFN